MYILASKAKLIEDASQIDFWQGTGGRPLALLPYDDCSSVPSSAEGYLQHKYYSDWGPLDRARPCRWVGRPGGPVGVMEGGSFPSPYDGICHMPLLHAAWSVALAT